MAWSQTFVVANHFCMSKSRNNVVANKIGLQYIDDHTASKDVTNVINFYDLQYFGENLQRVSIDLHSYSIKCISLPSEIRAP